MKKNRFIGVLICILCLFYVAMILLNVYYPKDHTSYVEDYNMGFQLLIDDHGLLGIDFGNDEVHKGRVLSKTDPLDWHDLFKLKVNDEINEVTDGHKIRIQCVESRRMIFQKIPHVYMSVQCDEYYIYADVFWMNNQFDINDKELIKEKSLVTANEIIEQYNNHKDKVNDLYNELYEKYKK